MGLDSGRFCVVERRSDYPLTCADWLNYVRYTRDSVGVLSSLLWWNMPVSLRNLCMPSKNGSFRKTRDMENIDNDMYGVDVQQINQIFCKS